MKRLTKAFLSIPTFSKVWLERILIVALVDIQLTYVLAFFNKEIAETLSITLVTEVVAVFITYSCKAYFETKAEKEHELKLKELELKIANSGTVTTEETTDGVG